MKSELPPLTRVEKAGLLVGLAMVALLYWPIRGYFTDDTFIHLQYARNLAGGHGLVFNLNERVYGCTSPLWVALLADGIALGLDGLKLAKLLGMVAAMASVALFLQLMRRSLSVPVIRAAATVAWASHAWMVRWAASGMETALAVALVLAGFVAFTEGKRWGARPVRTGALWALATLTRPEAGLLLGLWGVFLLIETEDRFGLRRLIAGTVPSLAIVGAWLLFARIYFGDFVPQTLDAKSAGSSGLAFHLDNLWRQTRVIGATDGVLLALLAVAVVLGPATRVSPATAAQRWLPWAWLIALPALYAARGVPVISRYLMILLPVLGWLAWRAAERWWLGAAPDASRVRRAGWLAIAVALAVVVQNLVVFQRVVVPHVREFSPALERSLVRWGRWFAEHTPPSTTIATPDIGAIGYFSSRRVVDLAGLVTPAMVPHLVRESPEVVVANFRFAAFSRPEFLIDRSPRAYELMRVSPYAECLTPLGHEPMPRLGIAQASPVTYTFYRVSWAAFDSVRAAQSR